MRWPSAAAGSTVIREPQASACAAPRELKLAAQAMESRAFTLVEMLVSLAVLSVALSVVGVVFTVTTKAVSQAAAISEVHAVLRQIMLQLEADLSGIEPSQSVLIISGRTQRAALNADDLAADASWRVLVGNPNDVPANYDPRGRDLDPSGNYSNPRTDILSFFTSRPMVSNAPATNDPNDPYLLGAKGSPVHVVYGHAALAEVDASGTWDEAHILPPGGVLELSRIPVSRWQIARRAVILQNVTLRNQPEGWPSSVDFDALRRSYSGDPARAADIAEFDLNFNLDFMSGAVLFSPYPDQLNSMPAAGLNWANEMLYGSSGGADATNRHVASVIRQPPAAFKNNVGVHMLPGCAWFQVEFLMPEDPRNSIDYFDPRTGAQRNFRTDMPQWTEVEEGEIYIFVPDTAANRASIANESGVRLGQFASMDFFDQDNIEKKRIRTWPYAIRVTVRVFDPLGRLEEPIVRSLIHRFD